MLFSGQTRIWNFASCLRKLDHSAKVVRVRLRRLLMVIAVVMVVVKVVVVVLLLLAA